MAVHRMWAWHLTSSGVCHLPVSDSRYVLSFSSIRTFRGNAAYYSIYGAKDYRLIAP